jgi:hypothetical protein
MEELIGILGLSAEDNLKLQCSTQNSQTTVVESRVVSRKNHPAPAAKSMPSQPTTRSRRQLPQASRRPASS